MEATLATISISPLLRTEQAAELLRVSNSFLMKARLRGDGPRYRKVGRSVRYSKSDLMDWLRSRSRTSTSE